MTSGYALRRGVESEGVWKGEEEKRGEGDRHRLNNICLYKASSRASWTYGVEVDKLGQMSPKHSPDHTQ